MLWIRFMSTSCEIALRWMPQRTFVDTSTLAQVMACCRQAINTLVTVCLLYWYAKNIYRDHFVYALSQWEATLHCNVASHWLGAYTQWFLYPYCTIAPSKLSIHLGMDTNLFLKCNHLSLSSYMFCHTNQNHIWSPGPDCRNDPLAIGSDTILRSWSADRIPQTPITIGSSERENTKSSSLLTIESWHKSFTGKFKIEITWSSLNEKRQTDDIYSWRHNGRFGDVIYEYWCESIMASSVHAHSVCSWYNTVWTCHVWQVCVCD